MRTHKVSLHLRQNVASHICNGFTVRKTGRNETREKRDKMKEKRNAGVSETKTKGRTQRGRLRQRDQRAGDRRGANDK